MPEPKKKKRTFEAQVNSQVTGLRLVRQQRPAAQQAGEIQPESAAGGNPAPELRSPEPELVSKLIDFIKSI